MYYISTWIHWEATRVPSQSSFLDSLESSVRPADPGSEQLRRKMIAYRRWPKARPCPNGPSTNVNEDSGSLYGWSSKLWSPFGPPKYQCLLILRTQNGTLILTTTHVGGNEYGLGQVLIISVLGPSGDAEVQLQIRAFIKSSPGCAVEASIITGVVVPHA